MNALTIISQSIAAGGLAGARPIFTLALLVLWGRYLDPAQLPASMEWLTHEVTMGVLAVLSVAEHFVRTDPDLEEVLRVPNAALGVVVALCGATILAGMGDDPARWQEVAVVQSAGVGAGLLGASAGFGAMASVALTTLRQRILAMVPDLDLLRRGFGLVEAGGVLGVAVVVLALPAMSIALTSMMMLAGGLLYAAIYLRNRRREAAARALCPHAPCTYQARKEATECPSCGGALVPSL